MALITLIRHGQASFGAANYDQLSTLGYVQAKHLGNLFAQQQQQFNQVWMGAMARHRQTAESCLTAASMDHALNVHAGLNEFDHEQVLMKLDSTRFPDKHALMQCIAASQHPKKTLGKLFGEAMQRWQCVSLIMIILKRGSNFKAVALMPCTILWRKVVLIKAMASKTLSNTASNIIASCLARVV